MLANRFIRISLNPGTSTIFVFVNSLVRLQTEVYIKCGSVNQSRKYKNVATKNLHDFIINKITDYENNVI